MSLKKISNHVDIDDVIWAIAITGIIIAMATCSVTRGPRQIEHHHHSPAAVETQP